MSPVFIDPFGFPDPLCHFIFPGVCSVDEPPLEEKAVGHFAACHLSERVRTDLS